MTATVLIRLSAPMQSWGNQPRGAYRASSVRPTKSGVLGLVANALGRDYGDNIDDLAALRFAVRVDRPGTIELDYHTTGGGTVPLLPGNVLGNPAWRRKAKTVDPHDPDFYEYAPPASIGRDKNGELTSKPGNTNQTRDRYLADASFLVALTGDHTVTTSIAAALENPERAVYLGRKAYTPSEPLLAGHHEHTDAPEALTAAPRAARSDTGDLLAVFEVAPGTAGSAIVHDQPISYAGTITRGARAESRPTLVNPPHQTGTTSRTTEHGGYDFFEENTP
ncbi:type I-E CRISPR-associated protein Cas5/CasD [Rhodococcus baikonurensis]|uniref:Type I-E CRISPR-associated protein Cas5/CasD n=1 Tax=Rhodococcus baikonurensis TaxID=172041 RepID=A0ABV5XBY1_9NOCA